MSGNMISLCTTCMNRNEFLQETLPTWIKFPFDEIIIVDWSSRENLRNIISNINDKRIRLIEVYNQEFWKENLAKNLSISQSKFDEIFMIDSDVKIMKNPIIKLENCFIRGRSRLPGYYGTSLFSKNNFYKVNGLNENVNMYGYEPMGLYKNFKKIGIIEKFYKNGEIEHIEHSDELRIKFQFLKVNKLNESYIRARVLGHYYENWKFLSEKLEYNEIRIN